MRQLDTQPTRRDTEFTASRRPKQDSCPRLAADIARPAFGKCSKPPRLGLPGLAEALAAQE